MLFKVTGIGPDGTECSMELEALCEDEALVSARRAGIIVTGTTIISAPEQIDSSGLLKGATEGFMGSSESCDCSESIEPTRPQGGSTSNSDPRCSFTKHPELVCAGYASAALAFYLPDIFIILAVACGVILQGIEDETTRPNHGLRIVLLGGLCGVGGVFFWASMSF